MKRREMNFARQVLAQGAVSLVHSYWYNQGRDLIPGFSEEWRIFLTTSFSSNLLHLFDATVVFTCNFEFKDWLWKTQKVQTTFLVSTIRGIGSH
uniref:7TM_GPCR_Srx domain-containing protein n=1 Tax=Caenorhabditis tropicalis TaxID=1561998 RepID=A0A1I7SYB3_9PELO